MSALLRLLLLGAVVWFGLADVEPWLWFCTVMLSVLIVVEQVRRDMRYQAALENAERHMRRQARYNAEAIAQIAREQS